MGRAALDDMDEKHFMMAVSTLLVSRQRCISYFLLFSPRIAVLGYAGASLHILGECVKNLVKEKKFRGAGLGITGWMSAVLGLLPRSWSLSS